MAEPAASPKPLVKSKRRSWRRRWLHRLLILALLSVSGYFILTQSAVTRWIVMAQIGRLAGGNASASSVSVSPSGKVVIKNAKLRAPGVPGEAGIICSIKRVEAEFEWSSLLSGVPVIHRIELDQPTARVSQSIDDGTVNFAALKPPKNANPPKEVPKVIVHGGVIELGEHVTDPSLHSAGTPEYTALKRIDVGGEVIESPDEQGAKIFSFHEVEGAKPVPGGLDVQGRISQEGIRLTLKGLSLSTWTSDQAPSPTRELFRQAAMQGEIPRAVITYAYAGGWEARIDLLNVAVNLPVTVRPDEDDNGRPLPQSEADQKRLLRMEKVNGEMVFANKGVVGTLKGQLEELPYEVRLKVDGTNFNSPFVCTLESRGFALGKRPQIMKFAPSVARRRLEQFGDPTGIVDAKVTVTRGAPVGGKEAEVAVAGEINFHDVTSAFERFPYRFSKMTGLITFDANRVDLVSIDGSSPSGAKVHASGVISPPTDAAGVDLDIHVTNLLIDEDLRQAMRGRRRVLDAMFSEPRYQELLSQGLIATPDQHNAAQASLAALEAEQQGESDEAVALRAITARPVFELGGRAEVRVLIHRPVGIDAEWEDVETISIADAGILPEQVPYPLLADQVVIVKQDALAKVEGGIYRGLTGGTATVGARADFSKVDDANLPFVPDVEIGATDVPVNALLINCLPESEQLASSGTSLHQMLTDLHAAGLVDCSVKLGMNEKNEPFFTVSTTLRELRARPHSKDQPARLMLSKVSGKVTVTEDELTMGVAAVAGKADGDGEDCSATVEFWMPISAQLSDLSAPKPPPTKGMTLTAICPQIDTSLPIEDLVSIFAPGPGENLGTVRDKLEPVGLADLTVTVDQPAPGGETLTKVVATNPRNFRANAVGGRMGMDAATGVVTITTTSGPAPGVISAADLGGVLVFQDEPAGAAVINGSITTGGGNAPGSKGLTISLKDARFESALTQSAAREFGPPTLADLLRKDKVGGLYDMDLTLGAPAAPGAAATGGAPLGTLRPRMMQMTMNETPVLFTEVTGAIEFSSTEGRLRALRLVAPEWSATADGSWILVPAGSTAFQTTLSLSSTGMPKDLLAVLPDDLHTIFDDMGFSVSGPVAMTDAQLSLTFGGDGGVAAFKSNGRISLKGARMDVGAIADRVEGTLDYTASRTTAGVPVDFEVWALLDGFALSGVNMTNGRVRAASGVGQEVLVPLISADCHGGRVAGAATLSPPQQGKRHYEVQLQGSDIRFASLLSDFQAVAPQDPTQTPLAQLADDSRGRLDIGVSLAGIANDPDSRRGRGSATVGGGRIINIPLLVPLVRITNLQLPIEERLDYAFADYYVEGRQMIFNEVSISSKSVAAYGYGVASIPDLKLNLRFESKSRARIPVLTSVFEYLRNELATVVVTGTLGDPHMGLAPLSSAGKVLGRIFRGTPTPQQRTLDQIEQRTEMNSNRPLRSGEQPIAPR